MVDDLTEYEKAPVELPEVRILRLEPGDVLLLSARRRVSDAEVEAIGLQVRARFPDHEMVLLDNGLILDILRKTGD